MTASQPSRVDVAVVGAGISGLTAALKLQDAGIACTVYEASNRVGGRMHSDRSSWANGQQSEHGGELINTNHLTMHRLCRRFDLPLVDLFAVTPPGTTDTYHFNGRYYTKEEAREDFGLVYQALLEDIAEAGEPTLRDSHTPHGRALDQMSAYDWIESRVPGGHASPLGRLIDVAYNEEHGRETSEQSCLNMVYMLGDQPDPDGFEIYGVSDERYHIVGGNDLLPEAIKESLAAKSPTCPVRLGMSLVAIAQSGDELELHFNHRGQEERVVARHVVLAVPFAVLRTLDYANAGFSPLKCQAIEELGYGTNAKLHLQFKTRFWHSEGPWGRSNGNSYVDLGYQNSWEPTRGQDGETGIIVDYTGGQMGEQLSGLDEGGVQAAARAFLDRLEVIWPGVSAEWTGAVTVDSFADDPFFLGSYSCPAPGQYTAFGGYEGEREGNCHFAGEHTSIEFQGFMEGAAEAGERAAREVISDLSKT